MSFGAVLLALSAVQAVSQIGQGYAEKAEANFNATLLEGKAQLIDEQKKIEFGQYQSAKARTLSTSFSNIAASGIAPQGSAMAVLLETQRQLTIDQSIGQFNLEQEKQFTIAGAGQARRGGKAAVSSGFSNAFSTLLSGGASYGRYKDTTFDSVK